ncbi:MAG: alanine racemase [Lachnospiraceae bacterium]|nr:alanine racemase [Lachnospiraceae bacterium]
MRDGTQRVAAYIDLSAIRFNIESMKANLAPGTLITAVIKTDGYGHGAVPIAEYLEGIDYLWGFAVATFEEARQLRDAGIKKPVLILGYTFPYCYQQISELELRPAVFRKDTLAELSKAAEHTGKDIAVHIAVDTAMSRIGIFPDDSGLEFVNDALHTPGLNVEGIFTHFSKADEAERDNTISQIGHFRSFCERIDRELGYVIPVKHCSNSAGIISYKYANMDMVRAGITLYGLWPSDEVPKDTVPLRPVMSLRSHVVYVKEIDEGTAVSYGGTYVAKEKRKIATIPAGYGDGYPRSLSNKGYVLIRGRKAPITGRICMDQFMVDVTDIPDVCPGDEVTLVGKDGDEEITMEMLGDLSGRFNYELACDINQRVPRVTVNGDFLRNY